MIDSTMFRDGEVQRTRAVYGKWTLTCDVLPRLGRKYCSLHSAPAALGAASIDLTVSTGDDGRPAALLRLPFGLALAPGVTIGGGVRGRVKTRQVPIALCDRSACVAVWTMNDAELDMLRRGLPVSVGLRPWTPGYPGYAPPPPIAVSISGRGFPEALSAAAR